LAEKQFGAQLHLLDDGFQHRGLERDLNLVLLTADDLVDTLLPMGRLREPVRALARADVVALEEGIDAASVPLIPKRVWRVRRGIHLRGISEAPVVFCGIARPKRFFDQLAAIGVRAVAHKTYSDHHAYAEGDVDDLLQLARANNSDGFITTEKDAVNLGERRDRLGDVTVAQVTLAIEPGDALDAVLRLLALGEPPHEKIRSQ